MKLIKIIKNTLAPIKCYACKKEWFFLCDSCSDKVRRHSPYCHICKSLSEKFKVHENCKNEVAYYDAIIIKYYYNNWIISKSIKDTKYYGKKDILDQFWKILSELYLENLDDSLDNLIITSVPMHFIRKLKRWYNHSDLLARSISKNTQIPYHKTLIKRKKYTRQQSKIRKDIRAMNLRNAFAINTKHDDILDKKTIILVDDVVSTGSTLNEVAKTLKDHWAQKVIGLCFAWN